MVPASPLMRKEDPKLAKWADSDSDDAAPDAALATSLEGRVLHTPLDLRERRLGRAP